MEPEKVVVNRTNRALDPAAVSILSKCLNYTHTWSPKSNLKDVISGVDRAIHHLPTETAEEIRQEICRFLGNSKPPQKKNTSKAERDTLQALRNNKDITVLPADKGNATIVLLNEDYHSKIRNMLSDPVYKKLTADTTNKI
jgi:hypothetical protein